MVSGKNRALTPRRRRARMIGIVDNNGPNTVASALARATVTAKALDLQVAFLSSSGVRALLPHVRQLNEAGRRVRILTGLYLGITDPAALTTLLKAQRQVETALLEVRLSRHRKFHRKLYVAWRATHALVIIGSSNLTKDGLSSPGELCSISSVPRGSSLQASITRLLEQGFSDERSVPLTKQRISAYRNAGGGKRPAPISSRDLDLILGKSDREVVRSARSSRGAFVNVIWERVSRTTRRAVAASTDWDRRGWSWYGDAHYQQGTRLLLIDRVDRKARLVTVMDIVELSERTPDGRQFVAYRIAENTAARRFSSKLWSQLRSSGALRNRSRAGAKRLTSATWSDLIRVFRR